jgi:pyridoxal phosphate enzyme (YggS family)
VSEPIAERLAALRERIARAARAAGRDPAAITLIGVAKGQPAEAVVAAIAAGLADVAENFAQEARNKIPEVLGSLGAQRLAAPRWHFVGQLQRNKVRLVAPVFDCIQTVDRAALAEEISRRAADRPSPIEVLLQVNLDAEPAKGGAAPEELGALFDAVLALPRLTVRGLMAVPAPVADMRPAFARLRALRDGLARGTALPVLSMGMSDDFEAAVLEGATHVRIGTALFGARRQAP